MIQNVYEKIEKFFLLSILRKKYRRLGNCKGCGRCCREIYVKHAKDFIKDEEEFKGLKKVHPFYSYLKIREKTETGLVFECQKLDKETGRCTVYKSRALLCRLYPQEEIFMLGGVISDDCGYKFAPIQEFSEVFKKIQKKYSKTCKN